MFGIFYSILASIEKFSQTVLPSLPYITLVIIPVEQDIVQLERDFLRKLALYKNTI